jgi:hypothetical protein
VRRGLRGGARTAPLPPRTQNPRATTGVSKQMTQYGVVHAPEKVKNVVKKIMVTDS